MKKYILPLLVANMSLNAIAQTPIQAQLAKLPPAQAALLLNKAGQLDKSVKQHLMFMLFSVSKVDPQSLMSDGQVKADEIFDLSEKPTTAEEMDILKKMAVLVDSNQLKPAVEKLVAELTVKADQFPQLQVLKAMSVDQKEYVINSLVGSITAVVQMRGLSKKQNQIKYKEWQDLSALMEKKLNEAPPNSDILHFSNTRWVGYQEITGLIDGKNSFAKRDDLMKKATKSIKILTWSIYDDVTGNEAVKLLLEKKNKDKVDIKIILDGQVAMNPEHRDNVKKLEEAGIQVVRWFSPLIPFQGQHRKMIVVDDQHVVAGGMNFGDVYSHKNPDLKVPRWRDTDVYFNGSAAIEASNLFAKIWNQQVDFGMTKFSKISLQNIVTNQLDQKTSRLAIMDHDPLMAQSEGSTVMMTLLKGIRDAKESIDIENAYVVLFPALKNEIENAKKRNVHVRVLTNSTESVDEPIVSVPILRSAKILVDSQIETYVKKGHTLHSKFAIIDNRYTMIMSYNLHPRSERVEGEMAVLVDSRQFAQRMTSVFEKDISNEKATNLNSTNVDMPSSPAAIPSLRLFFDLL